MKLNDAYLLTNKAESIVMRVRDNMIRVGHPSFKPLIQRANRILWALNNQRREINNINSQSSELGVAFLPALIWAGGIATFGAVSKWISDAYQTTATIKETSNLAERYGPEQTIELLNARNERNMDLTKILWFLGLAIGGYFLTRTFK